MSNKRFGSVSEMLRETGAAPALVDALEQRVAERALVKHLVVQRVHHGFSQADMAQRLGRTQSWVSKFEASRDAELRLGEVEQYLAALGLQFRPVVSRRSQKAVDEVKYHALRIQQLLQRLAALASDDDPKLAAGVARFALVEVPINLVKMMLDLVDKFPTSALEGLTSSFVEAQTDSSFSDLDPTSAAAASQADASVVE